MRVGRVRHSFIVISGRLVLILRSLVAGSAMRVEATVHDKRALPPKRTMTAARINQWNSRRAG
jgi:hypothetical protein